MKCVCEHCGEIIHAEITQELMSFEPGRVTCPSCHRVNKRYLSELDIIVFLFGAAVIYSLAMILPFALTGNGEQELSIWWTVAIIIGMVAIIAWAVRQWAVYVYVKAPFKKDWKDNVMKTDDRKRSRRLLIYILVYIVVLVLIGSVAQAFAVWWTYPAVLGVLLLVLYLRGVSQYRKERQYYEEVLKNAPKEEEKPRRKGKKKRK